MAQFEGDSGMEDGFCHDIERWKEGENNTSVVESNLKRLIYMCRMRRDFKLSLETMIRFVGSLATGDDKLYPIQAVTSWSHMEKVTSQLYAMQLSNERTQEILSVYIKWADDEMTDLKKDIGKLDQLVSVASDQRDELNKDQMHNEELLNQYARDLKKAEEQVEDRHSKNWRIAKVVTTALEHNEIEARRAYAQLEELVAEHRRRHSMCERQLSECKGEIAENRNQHERFISDLCEKDEEKRLLHLCFTDEKSNGEEIIALKDKLDPIEICCQILCEVCRLSAVPMEIMPAQVLDELRKSLLDCSSESNLNMIQAERENLDVLTSSLDSLNSSNSNLSIMQTEREISDMSLNNPEHLPVSDFYDEDQRLVEFSGCVNAVDMADTGAKAICSSHYLGDVTGDESQSSACNVREDLVMPRGLEELNLKIGQTYIKKMEVRNSISNADFSLKECPPTNGFDHLHWPSSFQACLIQLQNQWWTSMTWARNTFHSFQICAKLLDVCLLQAQQTILMGGEQDLKRYNDQVIPVLEWLSRNFEQNAQQTEDNFTVLKGIIDEMVETCTEASQKVREELRELQIKFQVNSNESSMAEKELKEMLEKRKAEVESILQAEQQLANLILELPGAINALSTTAALKVSSAVHSAGRFFKRVTHKLLTFDIFGVFKTVKNECRDAANKIYDFFTNSEYDVETGVEATPAAVKEERNTGKNMLMYVKIQQLKPAVETMLQMLLQQGNLNIQGSNDIFWTNKAKAEVTWRQMEKSRDCDDLQKIVIRLFDVCRLVLGEAKAFTASDKTYQQVISDLLEIQGSLETLSTNLKTKLDAEKAAGEKLNSTPPSPTSSSRYHRLEGYARKRCTAGSHLQGLLSRYDRHAEDISSHWEFLKDMKSMMAQLNIECSVLDRNLELMSEGAIDLVGLKENIHDVDAVTMEMGRKIKTNLVPKINKTVQQMKGSLGIMEKSKTERISALQQDTILQQIAETEIISKAVYGMCRTFIAKSSE